MRRNLRKLRRDAGMTQYGLSRQTKIPRWRISHAELGLLKLTQAEINSIAKTLVEVSRKKAASVLELADLGAATEGSET